MTKLTLNRDDIKIPRVLTIDKGSALIKARFSNKGLPTLVFPAIVGWKRDDPGSIQLHHQALIGEEAIENREGLYFSFSKWA